MNRIENIEQAGKDKLAPALAEAYSSLDAMLSEKEEHLAIIKESMATITDLKEKLAAKSEEKSVEHPVISLGGEKYTVVYPAFHFEGKTYKADDLKTDLDLAQKLLDVQFGGLVHIRPRKKS
jgi:hypothetical protein